VRLGTGGEQRLDHLARLGVGVDHDDRRLAASERREAGRNVASRRGQALHRFPAQVVRVDLEAASHQARRHGRAHHPEPDEADAVHGSRTVRRRPRTIKCRTRDLAHPPVYRINVPLSDLYSSVLVVVVSV